ncbi:FAD-dependent oxidoreductase [Mesorhizobium sp. B4-1-1]|uniref:NAD(P)/FAD-dependent oxidoreductase n=1 Tax=Mesorhizobium sp. B4-1-1 TaxID=2589890 RepID=UPI00112772CA|nr:FAD-dependent oxidoreductase [Mesorhizobium sp. B4-1-1]TPI11517.1 FAD-dependent oxidoreductase [Mesorhizobium sp. B4-1-1]
MQRNRDGTSRKVTVIGAGIVGVCSANYLLKQGFEVEVIDPALPGSEDQCSYGNAGGICPGSCLPNSMPGVWKNVPKWLMDPEGPLYVRLAYLPHALPWLLRFLAASRKSRVEEISAAMRALHRYTFECYEPLMKEAGCEELLQKRGQLFVYESADGPGKSNYGLDLRRAHGVRVDILDADEIRQLEPALASIFKSAVYLPEQGQCPNPGRLVRKLAENAARQGARFLQARVKDFELNGRELTAVVLEGGQRRPVDQAVLAAGAWSAALARKLGNRIPFETERGYHVMVKGADTGLRIQTISADRKFVASPMEEGLRIAGNVEFSGLRSPPNMVRADTLLKQARPMFRTFKEGEVKRWMGHRPGTPDSIPVIDRAKRARNVVYAFGHGHQGLIGGSVTGKLVAELAAGLPATVDLSPFSADRF